MLAAHHRPNNPTGKRLGLPHSHFEKTQLTDSTIYNVQPLKNRRFSSPVAKDGLVGARAGHGKNVFEDQKGRALLFPVSGKSRGHFVWPANERAQDDLGKSIAVEIASIHRDPAPRPAFREGEGLKIESAFVFQVHKTLLRAMVVIRKVGDGGDVQITVPVEIFRNGAIGAVHREQPGSTKM